jgi:hypothetical protein
MPTKTEFFNSFFVYVCLLHACSLFVKGFHVTKRSQSGDDVFGRMDDVCYSTFICTEKQQKSLNFQTSSKSTTLVPVSTKPLLFLSSGSPVLTPTECSQLSTFFSKRLRSDNESNIEGHLVFEKLQRSLDRFILRLEDNIVEPRYLVYDVPPEVSSSPVTCDKNPKGSTTNDINLSQHNNRFPDGLHVDTNNGKFFRYLTVLVYLTSSNAATVFPLANLDKRTDDHAYHVTKAAKLLILANILHTRQESKRKQAKTTMNEENSDTAFVEEDIKIQQQQSLVENSNATGVRIVPDQGHVAVFVGVDPSNGRADPYSFHGSELVLDEKQVLTFFYEIPSDQFSSQKEFGYQVGLHVDTLKQKYCLDINF